MAEDSGLVPQQETSVEELARLAQPLYQMYLDDKKAEREVERERLAHEGRTDQHWYELELLRLKADLSHRTEEMRWAVFLAVVFVGLGAWLAVNGQQTLGYALITFVVGAGGGYGLGSRRSSSQLPAPRAPHPEEATD